MVPQTRSDTSGDRARQAGHGLVCLPRASASLAVSSAGQVSIRSRGQSAAKLATACRCARPCRPATGGRAGSGAGPKVLGFPPAGFRKEPEQHHEQCCWNEGDQPGCREPVASAGHCAEGDQAGDGAQHTRGQRSNCPNPAAKAAIAAPTTARSLQRCNRGYGDLLRISAQYCPPCPRRTPGHAGHAEDRPGTLLPQILHDNTAPWQWPPAYPGPDW